MYTVQYCIVAQVFVGLILTCMFAVWADHTVDFQEKDVTKEVLICYNRTMFGLFEYRGRGDK